MSRFVARFALLLVAPAHVGLAQAEAQAQQDWLRFHIGFALGESDLNFDPSSIGIPDDVASSRSVDTSGTGAKLVAGFRPVRVVGAEIQYLDLGEETISGQGYGQGLVRQGIDVTAEADAWVLTALLFIPEPSPSVDLYAKVGVARIEESTKASGYDHLTRPECQASPSTVGPGLSFPAHCAFASDVDQSHSGPYLGFGVRFRIARAGALRFEYESIDRDDGDPATMLSVGIAHEFR